MGTPAPASLSDVVDGLGHRLQTIGTAAKQLRDEVQAAKRTRVGLSGMSTAMVAELDAWVAQAKELLEQCWSEVRQAQQEEAVAAAPQEPEPTPTVTNAEFVHESVREHRVALASSAVTALAGLALAGPVGSAVGCVVGGAAGWQYERIYQKPVHITHVDPRKRALLGLLFITKQLHRASVALKRMPGSAHVLTKEGSAQRGAMVIAADDGDTLTNKLVDALDTMAQRMASRLATFQQ